MNKQNNQPEISLTNINDFSVREIMQHVALLESLKDADLHGKIIWSEIERLTKSGADQLPRIIGQIDLLNVEHPEWIGKSHSLQLVSQLKNILTTERFSTWYLEFPREIYEAIINDLESGGGLAKYVNGLEKERIAAGIATPIPLIDTMTRIKKAIGKEDAAWSIDIVRNIASILSEKSLDQLAGLYPNDYVYTTTGFGRTPFFEAVKPFIRFDGTYIEVGSSLGIFAADVKKALGFKRLVATDIISEQQAGEITSVTDFQKGGKVLYTEQQRNEVEAEIDRRLWEHNILEEKIAPHITDKQGFFCFGFHNVLAHLIDRDAAVRNAIEDLIKPGDVIWVSGGYSANIPILRNLLYKITAAGADTYLIHNNNTTHLNSLSSVVKKVKEGRSKARES
jgi:hypothetical protein